MFFDAPVYVLAFFPAPNNYGIPYLLGFSIHSPAPVPPQTQHYKTYDTVNDEKHPGIGKLVNQEAEPHHQHKGAELAYCQFNHHGGKPFVLYCVQTIDHEQ